MSSAVLAKTDSDLRKRLETLEARILELEGRLESKEEQGERTTGSPDHSVGKEKFHDGETLQQRSSAPPAQTDNEFKKKSEAVGARAVNVEGPAAGAGWQDTEGGGHGFDRKKFHGGVTLKQDAFFGFQTILDAEYEVLDNIDFTFYSWLWTSPNFGRSRVVSGPNGTQVDAGGNGLWIV